jgi:prophage DNA circulation protein
MLLVAECLVAIKSLSLSCPPDRERATQAEVMLMRAQLAALVTQVQVFQTQLTTSVATSVETLTTSVEASVAAVEGDVANMSTTVGGLSTTVSGLSTTVSGLSTTVSGLSTVAATGDFSDLTGRPSAVSAISVGANQRDAFWCNAAVSYPSTKTRDIGPAAGTYCAMSLFKYTHRP